MDNDDTSPRDDVAQGDDVGAIQMDNDDTSPRDDVAQGDDVGAIQMDEQRKIVERLGDDLHSSFGGLEKMLEQMINEQEDRALMDAEMEKLKEDLTYLGNDLKVRKAQFKTQLEESKAQLKKSKAQLKKSNAQLEESNAKLESEAQRAELMEQLKDAEMIKLNEDLKVREAQFEAQLEESNEKLSESEAQRAKLMEQLKMKEADNAQLKQHNKKLHESIAGISGLSNKRIEEAQKEVSERLKRWERPMIPKNKIQGPHKSQLGTSKISFHEAQLEESNEKLSESEAQRAKLMEQLKMKEADNAQLKQHNKKLHESIAGISGLSNKRIEEAQKEVSERLKRWERPMIPKNKIQGPHKSQLGTSKISFHDVIFGDEGLLD